MARRTNQDDVYIFHDHGLHIPTRTIQFPSPTGDCDIDQAGVNKTMANFHILESLSHNPITLILNSYGGDVYQALGLYDFIKGLQSEVHIKTYGACMSGATLILQAGDKRSISANTTFMMHVGTETFDDHQKNVYRWAIHGEKVIKPRMKEIYAGRMTKLPKESNSHLNKRIDSLMDFDTILTAEEVVKLGLADEII
jgi:ATP-dependent Clp protease protease subunit